MNPTQRRKALPLSTLGLMAGILLGRGADSAWPAWTALVLCVLGLLLSTRQLRLVFLALTAVSLSAGLGWQAYHPALPAEGSYTVSGIVAEELRVDERHVRTSLRSVTLSGIPLRGGAYWSFYGDVPDGLLPGQRVTLRASLYHPSGAMNPGGYDFREALLQQGISVGIYGAEALQIAAPEWNLWALSAALRHHLSDALQQRMGEEAGGYAAAMLLGLRSQVEGEDLTAFRNLGIAHVLSVSGYHTGVLAGLILALLSLLHAGRKTKFAILTLALAAYALLTGGNAPVVRSALLVILAQYARLRQRKGFLPYLLCAACCIQLLFQPTLLTSAGFHLTYGAMLGLAIVTPWLQRIGPSTGRVRRRLWQAFSASLGAQLGILLPELYWFQKLPLLGLLLNLGVFAVFSVILGLMWAVLFTLPIPILSSGLGRVTAWLLQYLVSGIRWMNDHGAVQLWTRQANLLTALAWCALLVALSLWWRRGRRSRCCTAGAAVLLLVLSLTAWPHRGVEYIQFSVGSADAAVLWDQNQVTVIDTGEDGQTVAAWLRQHRLSVDRLVLSHLHQDHAGGITALLETGIPIGCCIIPIGGEEAQIDESVRQQLQLLLERGIPIRTLARGDTLEQPSGTCQVLWPEAGLVRPGQDANESSLVLRVELCGVSLLLTGDLDGRYEHYVQPPVDILKVAHHGSKSSTSPEYLSAVAPQALILSCGDEARASLMVERAMGIPLYVTRDSGAVMLTFRQTMDQQGQYTVQTYR